jgi:uroporphyrinogen decarboxylase
VPIIDGPWDATIERWQREGMPEDVGYVDFFGLDKTAGIVVNNSPRYPETVVAETDEYKVITTAWGATLKNWKHAASTPEFLHFTVVDPDSWRKAKARMQPDRDRVHWNHLREHYGRWVREGYWISAHLWFGFDVTHAWMVGTERLLCALAEEPEWCMDMFSHLLDLDIKLLDMVWDAGYRFDGVTWPDDMGYKHNQFFSLDMYRRLLKPFHQRAIDWAHAKGIKAELHSCGDVNPFVPELVAMGLDGLNPLEVKAGMDPVHLKRTYGGKLLLHGGINAVLWDQPERIKAEIERVVPVMKARGGYIFGSDHSVPSSVSLEDFRQIVALAKRVGAY